MKTQIILVLLIASFPFSVFADDDKKDGTYLNISATESREVDEDLLIANLRFESEGQDARDVQSKINSIMKKALGKAKELRNIKVSTERYSVYKYHPRAKKGEITKIVWRGSQSMLIKGIDAEKILKLTGELQNMGLVITGLNYVVSPEKREEVRDSLMEIALEKLIKKSRRVAKAIGRDDIEIVNINIDAQSQISPMRQNRMMTASSKGREYAAPIAAPGQSQIDMTVFATVLIKD